MIALELEKFDEFQRLLVLREIEGDRYLFIRFGERESSELERAIRGESFGPDACRATWMEMIEQRGAILDGIAITDLVEGAFKATVWLTQSDRSFDLPARPADGLAWAIRSRSPISATGELMRLAGLILRKETVTEALEGKKPLPDKTEIGFPVKSFQEPYPFRQASSVIVPFAWLSIIGCGAFSILLLALITLKHFRDGDLGMAVYDIAYCLPGFALIAILIGILSQLRRMARERSATLEVFPLGFRVRIGAIVHQVSWASLDRVGQATTIRKVDGLIFKKRRGLSIGIPLAGFEPNWREGEIGILVRRYAPRLFGIEPVDPEGGSPIF
jgi:uncharacterized protein